jgi:SAM-dependent methyltransferase
MTQNIYDDPAFFAGYSRLARSVTGLDAAPEWPALRALLPDPRGLRIADLGCGFGWFCRWARAQGAASVLGVDVSRNMLARAMAAGADPAITYVRTDLEQLELPPAGFDLVYSSLALHYVCDLPRLLAEVWRALSDGGDFVFSIEHPVYMAPARPGWQIDAQGHRTWPVDGYAAEGPRTTDWLAPGVIKQHRRLSTTLNLLIDAGFAIRRVDEFAPSEEQVAARPELAEERERPMFVLVAARRRAGPLFPSGVPRDNA